MFENQNVVSIVGDLYVKTPEALEALLADLRTKGYEIKNLREEKRHRETPVEQMEKNGWSLWYVSMPDIRRGKCNSCNSLINVAGIQSHGHKCEVCGEVTYYKIIDGSTIRFSFINRDEVRFSLADLTLKAKRWDAEAGYLYLYPEVLDGLWLSGDRAKQYLEANADKWEAVEEEGQHLIKIRYPDSFYITEDSVINPSDIHGHYWNHKIVKVWDGQEYSEWGQFPIPESMSIYETWHWAPLPASPTLHERILTAAGQVSDKGYYYQDGRPAFDERHWKNMAKFVRHFTQLDADAFDRAWPKFRRSGPGGIDDLAHFCHSNPVVENKPNIGNTLNAMGKAFEGQPLTNHEIEEAGRGAASPEGRDFFRELGRRKR